MGQRRSTTIMAILIPDALLRPPLTRLCFAATSPWNRQNSNEIKSSYRVAAMDEAVLDADKFRAEFLRILRSRRSPEGTKLNSNVISLFSVLVYLECFDVCSG